MRPERRDELVGRPARRTARGGPWYVQPDSLLPGGETHVRNLLVRPRRRRRSSGRCRPSATCPTRSVIRRSSRRLLAGFGLDPFVYWRGNGAELDTLGPLYRWTRARRQRRCARGSSPRATSRRAVSTPTAMSRATVARLRPVIDRLVAAGGEPVLLMNGFDHLPPTRRPRHVAARARRAARAARRAAAATPRRVDARRVVGRARRRAARRTCCPVCGRRACR